MNGVGLIGAILIGILAGWIAEKIMKRNHGLLTNLVVGVVGAFLGSFVATTLGIGVGAGVIPSLITATLGAILLLFIVGLIRGRRA
ncbi:GlsB/YeaQ/YmgE family stress response membrane protein [Phenylobacterium sp. SCN 70-31]|uniref:GlsB/YeaQ/YmgE family stress response membrane protein n=1 Tax=Phenylobacterium sp. SCN 70-31 TaxID=1660129 RepID=UPI00086A5EE2|nr:GlsB/YeaQ/YmgE family stress response membrane protein [Phenylobacterium sp. SCN 70-31]ODT85705.1 MAG: hypothetical protein ABS78_19240 [Phenylobacterium sp. SCN 70-31]